MSKHIKKMSKEELLQEFIELGLEVEAMHHNTRFEGYDKSLAWDKHKAFRIRRRARQIVELLTEMGEDFDNLVDTNEDFEYSAQFM